MTPSPSAPSTDERRAGRAIDARSAPATGARSDLRVRGATPADYPAVCALLRDLDLDWPARDLALFFVAESRGQLVGIAELRPVGSGHLLSCVGVREDLQGRGLGRALVEGALVGVAGDVYLYTLLPGFFAKLGFVEILWPPTGVPPRRVYGCETCDPARCRCMVRRADAAFPAAGALRVEHLGALAAALPRSAEATCDLSAASLWIWRDCEAPSVTTVGGNLCIRIDPHHEPPYFLEPLGTGDVGASVDSCLRDAGRLSRVRAGLVGRLPSCRFDVVPLRDHFDYVCDVRRIAELRGAEHEGHRNRVRKFAREHPRHEARTLTAHDRDAALSVFDRWALAAGDPGGPNETRPLPSLACQRRALERAFDDFRRLGLSGCALIEDGTLLGFLLGSRSGDAVIAHFQYADATLPGAPQTLLVESCRGVFADAAWINLEEDLGIPGLRRTKLSWQPARLAEKFAVARHG